MKKLLYILLFLFVAGVLSFATIYTIRPAWASEYSVLLAAITTVDDFVDTEIATIDTEVGVIDGIVDNIYLGTWRIARCTPPDGSTTTWTQAAHNVFSVTGPVIIHSAVAFCTETLVGAGTIEFGEAGAGTDLLLDQVANATALATNDVWCGVTTDAVLLGGAIGAGETYAFGTCTLELVVGTADITDGTIAIYVTYLPLTATASIDSVAWD